MRCRYAEGGGEDFACPMHQDLAVGPGIIGGTGHSRQVPPPLLRFYGCAGKLAVREIELELATAGPGGHFFQEVIANLVPESSRTGVNENHDLVFPKTISPSGI